MKLELSIVMPCLNEAETLATCIIKAKRFLDEHHVNGEILIADNGSNDGSIKIAEQLNVKVIHVQPKGYGNALKAGISAASGQYIIMGDADDSYDFSALKPFLEKLREGFDLVMGNRFDGGIKNGPCLFCTVIWGIPYYRLSGVYFLKQKSMIFIVASEDFLNLLFLK